MERKEFPIPQLRIHQLKKLRDRMSQCKSRGAAGEEESEKLREQIIREEEAPTPATDIYSFGATVFNLATGRPPFHTGNVIDAHLNTAPPNPLELTSDLDPMLAQIILRCLEKAPPDRFTTTEELCGALERLGT